MDLSGPGVFNLLVWVVVVGGLGAFWIGALISISRRSPGMTGLELIGWYALVIFAQVIGTMVWFFVGRDRYAPPPPR